MNPIIQTIIWSLLPISELRGGIPVGLANGLTPLGAAVIAIAANLHLISSLPVPNSINDPLEPIIEFDRSPNPFRDFLAKDPIYQVNSRIMVPKKPGLGIEIDEDRIKRFIENPNSNKF